MIGGVAQLVAQQTFNLLVVSAILTALTGDIMTMQECLQEVKDLLGKEGFAFNERDLEEYVNYVSAWVWKKHKELKPKLMLKGFKNRVYRSLDREK